MAIGRTLKKTGRKAPVRKGGHKKQAKKPIGRKKPMGSGRKTAQRAQRARKTGKSARPTTKEPLLTGSGAQAARRETGPKTPAPARKAVRSGKTTGRKTRKDERPAPQASDQEA